MSAAGPFVRPEPRPLDEPDDRRTQPDNPAGWAVLMFCLSVALVLWAESPAEKLLGLVSLVVSAMWAGWVLAPIVGRWLR